MTTVAWPDELFSSSACTSVAEMETKDGATTVLASSQWHRTADRVDLALLARCRGAVLDVGCGPGRHVAQLVGWGHAALGIDTSVTAVAETRRRGAPAAQLSVFDPVPGAGRWGTALLLDGNIGIGGDIPRLLSRVVELLAPGGRVLIEMASPKHLSGTALVRIRHRGQLGDWFPWAWVNPGGLEPIARAARLVTEDVWHLHGRWFAQLGCEEFCS